jgi:hypothetical protein
MPGQDRGGAPQFPIAVEGETQDRRAWLGVDLTPMAAESAARAVKSRPQPRVSQRRQLRRRELN